MAGVGDNSIDVKDFKESFARIVNLDEQRTELAEDIKAELAVLATKGYTAKFVRKALAISKKDKDKYLEEVNTVDAYLLALDLI